MLRDNLLWGAAKSSRKCCVLTLQSETHYQFEESKNSSARRDLQIIYCWDVFHFPSVDIVFAIVWAVGLRACVEKGWKCL